jgi:hypothetical protein
MRLTPMTLLRRAGAHVALAVATLCVANLGAARSARADEIRNPTAIFAGLDKITGRIISFDVAIDETVQFGTLQITPRVCLTRPQTEAPLTEGFVEVDDVESAKDIRRIFSGWMFSASPGLHGVEHPVYDVWLKDCKGGKDVVASPASGAPGAQPAPDNAQAAPAPGRKPRTITPQEPEEPKVDVPPATDPLAPVDSAAPPADGAAAPDIGPAPAPGAPAPLPPPVEVGAPPGAGPAAEPAAPPVAAPAAPAKPKKPKKPKPKPQPAPDVERPPLQPQQAPEQPRREREQGFPNLLPRDLF